MTEDKLIEFETPKKKSDYTGLLSVLVVVSFLGTGCLIGYNLCKIYGGEKEYNDTHYWLTIAQMVCLIGVNIISYSRLIKNAKK